MALSNYHITCLSYRSLLDQGLLCHNFYSLESFVIIELKLNLFLWYFLGHESGRISETEPEGSESNYHQAKCKIDFIILQFRESSAYYRWYLQKFFSGRTETDLNQVRENQIFHYKFKGLKTIRKTFCIIPYRKVWWSFK